MSKFAMQPQPPPLEIFNDIGDDQVKLIKVRISSTMRVGLGRRSAVGFLKQTLGRSYHAKVKCATKQ